MNFYQLLSKFTILLGHVIGDEAATEAVTAVTEAVPNGANAVAQEPDLMFWISNVGIWVVFGIGIYFLMIRPPRKEAKAKNAMREAIKIGDSVLTIAGFYGKVVDIGTDVFVIELGNNRGVRVAVKKEAIEAIGEPILTPPPKESSEN